MQQRSVETRQLLMEATIDCIREMGYHRASTNEIVRRAGLSRGAMLHHYPTKHDLLVAAFGWVHEEISADIETLFQQAETDGTEWIDLLDEIMARYFQGRSWEAFVEIVSQPAKPPFDIALALGITGNGLDSGNTHFFVIANALVIHQLVDKPGAFIDMDKVRYMIV